MPRTARIVLDNAFFHILNRGNAKQTIFHDDEDFEHFLYIAAYYKAKYGFKIYHLCPMPNHFHFLWKIERAKDLSLAMHDISQTYTKYHHQKYQTVGYLWQGRFKNMLVEREDYLQRLGGYIERNPVRAGLVSNPEDWKWSSYRFYALGELMKFWIKMGDKKEYINLIDENPFFKNFGQNLFERQKNYQEFILGMNDDEIRKELGLEGHPRGRPRNV